MKANSVSTKTKDTGKIILLATVGTSPAVLTETVWALAHPAKKDAERVVPDEISVLTTLRGKQEIEAQLLGTDGAWPRLIAALQREGIDVAGKLAFGEASIRLLDHGKTYLEDIRTSEENESVADLFLREVRSYTENPKTCLYASIAGGRKTMGALLLSCMSLLGREQDHVLHILVNEPFEARLDPPFFFPVSKAKHVLVDQKTGTRTTFLGADARLDLIDLPFVKMRGWYQDKFKTLPPRYGDLVREAQSSGPAATVQRPFLKFDFNEGRLFVDETPAKLNPVEFMTFSVEILLRPDNLGSALVEIGTRVGNDMRWAGDFTKEDAYGNRKFKTVASSQLDLTHVRSEVRKKLKMIPGLVPFVAELVPRAPKFGTWPKARISADIDHLRRRIGL